MPYYQPGDILLNKYRIEKLLGSGGFGDVYLATHLNLNAPRAVKVLNRKDEGIGSTDFARYRERFELEARLGAAVKHPSLIQVFDLAAAGDELMLAMEYAPGGSLLDRLLKDHQDGVERDSQPLTIGEAVAMLRDLAGGLAVLHANGIVHRDIKPSNILFGEGGRAKIADLGIAQTARDGLTRRTDVDEHTPPHPATPAFMSPEQEATRAYLTPASDIYSLGVVMFLALTGQNPKLLPPGARVGQYRPDAPAWLEALVMRMLAGGPEWRPQAGELLQMTDAAGARIPIPDTPAPRWTPAPLNGTTAYTPVPPTPKVSIRRWWPAAAAAAGLGLLAVILLITSPGPAGLAPTDTPPVPARTATQVSDTANVSTATRPPTLTTTRTSAAPPTFTPTRTQPAGSPTPAGYGSRGLIAFVTGYEGSYQIQLYDPVTQTQTRLSGQHANSSVPSFSWDTRTVLYKATLGGGNHQIFSIPLAGGSPTQLTREGDNGEAVLSPDGRQIAYAVTISDIDKDLSLMEVIGGADQPNPWQVSGGRKLFNDDKWDDDPQWCPDGWLVFESSRDDHKCPGCTGVFLMNPSAPSTLFHVTRNTESVVTAEETTPACSPDGKKIAYEGHMALMSDNHIWIINRDGTGAARLTSGLQQERPAWSPDGKEIAYTQIEANGERVIYILALDNSHPPLRVGRGEDAVWSRPLGK